MISNRRQFLAAIPATFLLKPVRAETELPLAICNEIFRDWSLADTCRAAKRSGYSGIEFAPFTLSEDLASLSPRRRAEVRRVLDSEGLDFVGLHWLLSTPEGLHVTTGDTALRRRSWGYFRRLIDLCSDLGEEGVMVFGSSKQRGTVDGVSVEEAKKRLTEGLADLAGAAESQKAYILLEPLAPHLCDVVNTLEEAVTIVEQVGSPAVQTLLDVHNTAGERLPVAELVRKYYSYIKHVHVNEMDGGHLGTDSYDFRPLIRVLKELAYPGWVSLEVFDFEPGPEKIAEESAEYFRRIESSI